jgi:hypothetical protein
MVARAQVRDTRGRTILWLRALLGCALGLSLLCVRYSLPTGAAHYATHATRGDVRHFGLKQYVEHDDAQAAVPVATPRQDLVPQFRLATSRSISRVTLRTEGFHYNRPPPSI